MSLHLGEKEALLSVFGYGWNDKAVNSGEAGTEDGYVIKDISDAGDYDWGSDLNWDAVADYIGIDITGGYYLGEDGTIYTDDDGDGIYTDDYGNEYPGDGDYNPYGYYEDYDGVQYTDYDGDGVFTNDLGNEYPGDGTYFPSEVLTEKIDMELSRLANNEEAIYECMANHDESTGIPARIIVTNPPDRLEYTDGDTIDFTGIVVCAYTSLTARTPFIQQDWDGPRHNQIPFDQLTFPVTEADRSGADTEDETELPPYKFIPIGDCSTADAIINDGIQIYDSKMMNWKGYVKRATTYAKYGAFRKPESSMITRVYAAKYGTENTLYFTTIFEDGGYSRYVNTLESNYMKKLIYYLAQSTPDYEVEGIQVFSSRNEVFRAMLDGKWEPESEPVEVSVPVQWQTDYQEDPYEASFEITVT